MEDNPFLAHKSDLPNMINPHRWLKHFSNLLRTSRIGKSMSELSRVMENMLILENGEKFMKDVLAIKEPSFLVN